MIAAEIFSIKKKIKNKNVILENVLDYFLLEGASASSPGTLIWNF